MSDSYIRLAVEKAYPTSKTWPDKVKKMSDTQVYAVYMKLKGRGIIK